MKRIVEKEFFDRSSVDVAKSLVGKWFYRKFGTDEFIGQISEIEAYLGVYDSASHSFGNKKTERNKFMWGEPGSIYVYLCYGMYNMFNITCKDSSSETVFIRGIVGCKGPGKFSKYFNLDRTLNGRNILFDDEFCLFDDGKDYKVEELKRVGIDYANEKDRDAHLRFILKN